MTEVLAITRGGCDQRTKRRRLRAAERSYPTSEVRGSTERCYPTPPSLRPGAAGGRSYHSPPRPRPGAAAGRRNPMPEARGSSREDPMAEGRQPRRVTPRPRPGAAAGRRNPMPEARGSSREDQPHPRSRGCMGASRPRGAIHVEGQEGQR